MSKVKLIVVIEEKPNGGGVDVRINFDPPMMPGQKNLGLAESMADVLYDLILQSLKRGAKKAGLRFREPV